VVSLFLDGIRLGVRCGTREKEAILVAHAVLADGRREVLAVALGSRESTRAWTELLEDLKRRGLPEPLLLITDGGGGLLAAVEACFPDVPRQHCTNWTDSRFPMSHWKRIRTTNVLERSFREVRRQVREVGRFQDEMRALALVHALLQQEAQAGWQRLSMTPEAQCTLAAMRVQQSAKAA